MTDPFTIVRLALLLSILHQVCGTVISVPEEMVPENLMMQDSDSESGFSINKDVLSQLLEKMYSSSMIRRPGKLDDQASCGACQNEEEEYQDNHEKLAEENMNHQADNSNYHKQSTKQISENIYSRPVHRNDNYYRLQEQSNQNHAPIHKYEDSGKETFSTERGFSINKNVLNKLLDSIHSSSMSKMPDNLDDETACGGRQNEEEEYQDNHEEHAEENTHHQADNSNYHKQSTKQISENIYSRPVYLHDNFRFQEQVNQNHVPTHKCEDSGKETFATQYPRKSPPTVYQQRNGKAASNSYQSAGVDYQAISGQYPFTEFSRKAIVRPKPTKAPSSNQYLVQDSSEYTQQRYEQQPAPTRPSFRSNTQTYEHSGRQPTLNVQSVQQEQAHGEQPPAGYRQYHPCTPEYSQPCHHVGTQPSPSPRLLIGNASLRRRSST